MKILRQLFDTQPSPALVDAALLVFRVLAGLALLRVHGWDKVAHYAEEVQSIPDPFGLGGPVNIAIAIFSDVVCALLIVVGLATRPAAFFVLNTTLVGLLFVHLQDDWHGRDVPLVYSIMYLVLLLLGPGRYSLDHWLGARLGFRNRQRPYLQREAAPQETAASSGVGL